MSITIKNLPRGWVVCRLGDGLILDIQPGFACGTHNRSGEGIVHLRPMNISSSGSISLSDVKYIPRIKADKETRLARKGDVLFNNTNSPELVGKTAYYYLDEPLAFSNHMTRLHCNSEILNPRFCAFFFHYKWLERYFLTICNKHVSQASVSRAKLEEISLTLPPLLEQQRIATKLDTIMPKIEAVNTRLERIPQIIKRFRQSVLTAAVIGKLTEQWREEHPEVGSAEVLIKKIFGEINARIKDKKKYLHFPEDEVLKRFHSKWCNTYIAPLLNLKRRGIKTGPFGSALKKSEHKKEGVPVLGIENIGINRFIPGNKIFITEEKAEELSAYDVKPNDIIISRSGTVGELCVVPPDIKDARISTNLIRVALNEKLVMPKFFTFFFYGSSTILNQLEELCSGSTRKFLNQKILNKLIFSIPPLEEQHEIVRQVDKLFAFAEKLEAHYHNAKAKVEKLPQSVLAKAFRGELVSQNPDDEPAEKLLERVKAEKVRLEKKGKKV